MKPPVPLPADKPELRRYIASRPWPPVTVLEPAYAEGAEPQPDYGPGHLPQMEAD